MMLEKIFPSRVLTVKLEEVDCDGAILCTTIFSRDVPIRKDVTITHSLILIKQALIDAKNAVNNDKLTECVDGIIGEINTQMQWYGSIPTQLYDFACNLTDLQQFEDMRKINDGKPPTFLLDISTCLTFKI